MASLIMVRDRNIMRTFRFGYLQVKVEAGEHVLAFPVVFSVFSFVVVSSEEVESHNGVQVDDTDQQSHSQHKLLSVMSHRCHDSLQGLHIKGYIKECRRVEKTVEMTQEGHKGVDHEVQEGTVRDDHTRLP